jgi:hypothetical protein
MIDKKKIDFSGPSANAQLLEQMSQDAAMIKKRGGGMMNMDEMIRPIGYEVGGIVPRPKPKPRIVPKEKPIDFDALMAEFDKPENKLGPGERSMLSKILNTGDPVIDREFQFRQFLKKMLGMLPKE